MIRSEPFRDTIELAKQIRVSTLKMVHAANASHVGSCFSMADILAVLYGEVLRYRPSNPDWPDRDRVIVSKGHAAAIVYAVLAEVGYFPKSWLDEYCQNGSRLAGHVTHKKVPGVEFSTGSLGHGLSIGSGLALAAKAGQHDWRTFVILSDGECDEGSIWEAALFAPHHKLNNLVAIVDYNKIQSFGSTAEVLDLEPFTDKWESFGWNVIPIDGHDHDQLRSALAVQPNEDRPTVVIANTIKGKGVTFMENELLWHYRSPSNEQLQQAISEVEGV
ncbi:transketolase [bacterium]|nr:transketolase [bacterium]